MHTEVCGQSEIGVAHVITFDMQSSGSKVWIELQCCAVNAVHALLFIPPLSSKVP